MHLERVLDGHGAVAVELDSADDDVATLRAEELAEDVDSDLDAMA